MNAGIVTGTLIQSAINAGVPEEIAQKLPLVFERPIHNGLKVGKGDDFRIIYERQFLDGDFVRNGKFWQPPSPTTVKITKASGLMTVHTRAAITNSTARPIARPSSVSRLRELV